MKHAYRILVSIFLFFILYIILRILSISPTNNSTINNSIKTNNETTNNETDIIHEDQHVENDYNEINNDDF